MAIARDNHAFVASQSGTGTSLTGAYTVNSNTNGYLVVAISNLGVNVDNITGVAYNGVSMTLVDSIVSGDTAPTANNYSYVFQLYAPATGTNNVVVTFTSSADNNIACFAVSYTGVKQSGQPDAFNSGASGTVRGSSLSFNTTVVASNCWVYGFGAISGFGSDAAQPTAGLTLLDAQVPSQHYQLSSDSNGTVSTGAYTTSWALTSGTLDSFSGIAVSFSPASTTQILKVSRVAQASISKVSGIANASIKKISGVLNQ